MFGTRKRIKELEEENESLKDENMLLKIRGNDKNAALLDIYRLLVSLKSRNMYGEAGYRDLFRQITDLVEKNTEKKLSDEILPHFTSNS